MAVEGKVEVCHLATFNGVECYETKTQFGFFKSEVDVRPGHAIWINKDNADRLFELFASSEESE